MNRSRSKRATRKKVIPLHFQKSQTSLSQILTTASYKRRIKELQKNNKVLAVALQDARIDLANSNNLLQRCSNDEAKILQAKTKVKEMVTCIQTLVTGLNEVMCCLDIKPISWFNSTQDEVKMKIRQPDLDPIEESNSMIEDSITNISASDRNVLSPVIHDQGLMSDKTAVSSTNNSFKEISDAQKDLNAVVEDQGATTSRPYKSIPHASPPDSPLTPELDIPHSADYYQKLLELGIISRLPENVILENKVNPTSLKEGKSISKIPIKKKNPLPFQSIEFSPPVPKLNRKTFVVNENASKSSGTIETSVARNTAQDVNRRNRRGTYTLTSVSETVSPTVIGDPSGPMDPTIHFDEDMELTSVIPIHKMTPVKNDALATSNATTLCNENSSVVVPEQKKSTLSLEDVPRFNCPDMNQDMEFTCVIPIYNLPHSENNKSEGFNIATACANDLQSNRNVSKSVDNILAVEPSQAASNPGPSKLTSDKQDSTDALVVSAQKKTSVVSKDNSPTFKCPDVINSPILNKSLKRGSSRCSNQKVSFKTKGRKNSNRNKRSSVGFKNTASPKSPKLSVGLEAVSQNELNSISKPSHKRSIRKNTVTYAKYFSSDSDNDDETLNKKKIAVESIITDSPNSVSSLPDIEGSISSQDSESNLDDNLKDDLKSFGRCNLKSPRKTSKRRGPYTFGNAKKTSKIQCDQSSNKRKSVQTKDVVTRNDIISDDSSSLFEIKLPSPQNSRSAKSSDKNNKISKSHKPKQKSSHLKPSDQKIAIDCETVSETNKKSCNKIIESHSVLNSVTSPSVQPRTRSSMAVGSPSGEEKAIYSTTSNCRKSVQFAFNECFNAFQNIKTQEQLMTDSNRVLNGTEKNNMDSERPSSSGLSNVSNRSILKNRHPSQKKSSQRISHKTSNSTDEIENLPKPSQTAATRLDELLASLDSSVNEDNECNSKDIIDSHDSALQLTKGDQIKRPFSGVSERNSKKRATDYGSDVFNEIETICLPEIGPRCLGTVQQNQTGKTADNCEETEIYDLKDIVKTRHPKTEYKQYQSQQSKNKSQDLKAKENSLNNQNVENSIGVVRDPLVNSSKAKSSTQAGKITPCKKDGMNLKRDKSKIKNVEVDILTTPLKVIQLASTESCTLIEINTHGGKILDKQKPHKEKNSSSQKKTKVKSKDPASSNTEFKKSASIPSDQNVQPSAILEPLPICLPVEDNSFISSKDSTSLGNERSRRARPLVSFKEPHLNRKMRR